MRDYTVIAPDGTELTITGPADATPEQIRSAAQRAFSMRQQSPQPKPAEAPKESEAFRQGRQAPGWQRGLSSALQGPTFGFIDEIAGGVRALADTNRQPGLAGFREAYERERDFIRGAAAQESEDNPITSTVTRLAASAPVMAVAPTLGAVRGVAAPMGAGRTIGSAAATGAAYGALSGVGESTAQSPEEIAADGLMGGLTGAAMSGATQGALGVGGWIRNAVGPRLPSLRRADTQGGGGGGAPSAVQEQARLKVAEALLRDAPQGMEDNAASVIGRAQARLRQLGPQARVADAAGENATRLLDIVATTPGRTANLLGPAQRERIAGRGERLRDAASDALGAGGRRLQTSLDDWMAQRKEAATPIYNELRSRFGNIPADDELKAIVTAAVDVGADKQAARIATANRQQFTLDPAGNQMRFDDLNSLKQGLDDMISAEGRAGNRSTVAALMQLKNELVGKLDEATTVLVKQGDEVQAVPLYQKARQAFAGPSALMNAAEEGRKVMSMDDQAIGAALAGLTKSEADAFRVGAFEALRSKLGTTSGQTQILGLWKEPNTQEKLRALFGNERDYRKFVAETLREGKMKRLDAVAQNSKTAQRQQGAADLDAQAAGDAMQAAGGLATGRLDALLMPAIRAANRVQTPEPVRDEIGRILLSRDPQEIKQLRDLLTQVNAARQGQVRLSGQVGGMSGAMAVE